MKDKNKIVNYVLVVSTTQENMIDLLKKSEKGSIQGLYTMSNKFRTIKPRTFKNFEKKDSFICANPLKSVLRK